MDEPDSKSGSGDGSGSSRSGGSFPLFEGWTLPLGPGERVGNYQIVRLIGSGGMGAVYEALQDRPRRTVALKVVKIGLGATKAIERFIRESQFLATLSHPAVAQVIEAGTHRCEAGEFAYYTMEHVGDGKPITAYATDQGLGIRERLELMARVCLGAEHGHERRIIHRDLKPANILVDPLGNPKIIDFGVARVCSPEDGLLVGQTRAGEIVGTLQYMSPEQAQGIDPAKLDARSDVYSLGLITYELLTGKLPYTLDGKDLPTAISIIKTAKPEELGTVDSRLRGDVSAVVRKALHKDRDLRYASAAEFAVDLGRVLVGKPPFALNADLSTKARVAWKGLLLRRWGTVVSVAAGIALLLASVASDVIVSDMGPVNRWFERRFAGLPEVTRGTPLEQVRVVQLPDDVRELAPLAKEAGIVGFDADDAEHPQWIRPLHAKLARRIAAAGARVIVFDVEFWGQSAWDAELCGTFDEIRRASQRTGSCDLVVGRGSCDPLKETPAGWPSDIPTGIAIAAPSSDSLSRGILAMKRSAEPGRPSLALLAALHAAAPGSSFQVEFDEHSANLVVVRSPGTGQAGSSFEWVPTGSILRVTPEMQAQDQARAAEGLETGVLAGDRLAEFVLNVPSPARLNEVTMSMADALAMPEESLRASLNGKVVLVGRSAPHDQHATVESGTVWGTHILANVTDQILRRQMPTILSKGWTTFWQLTGVACGVVIAWRFRRVAPRFGAGLALTGVFILVSIAVYWRLGRIANPALPVLGMAAAALIVVPLVWSRRRVSSLEPSL